MTKFVIIEDCSPYYVRYRHEGDEQVFQKCREHMKLVDEQKEPFHNMIPEDKGSEIIKNVMGTDILHFNPGQLSLFVSKAKTWYRPHKDGIDWQWGINYNIEMKDDLCNTSWFSDNDFEGRAITNYVNTPNGIVPRRGAIDFTYNETRNLVPLKTMTAKQGEVVLINTGIYHDVDNTRSDHNRTILTLRTVSSVNMSYNDIKNHLFGQANEDI